MEENLSKTERENEDIIVEEYQIAKNHRGD
jgi:hypothetical protein